MSSSNLERSLVRTPIAVLSAAGLLIALSACAAGAPTDGGETSAAGCEATPSGSVSDSVTVSGEFGAVPEVTIDGPLELDATQRTVAIAGDPDGKQALAGSTVNILYSV